MLDLPILDAVADFIQYEILRDEEPIPVKWLRLNCPVRIRLLHNQVVAGFNSRLPKVNNLRLWVMLNRLETFSEELKQ